MIRSSCQAVMRRIRSWLTSGFWKSVPGAEVAKIHCNTGRLKHPAKPLEADGR